MARPNKGRGRNSKQLPPLKVTDAEYQWLANTVHQLNFELGKATNFTKFMRDRIFADMPGYKPQGDKS